MEQSEEKYKRGFNNGYTLEEHEPALLATIMHGLELSNDYLVGMAEGRNELQQERTRGELNSLAELRDKGKEKEQDRDISRN